MDQRAPRTRIQKRNHETILDAALDVFSQEGFRGATLDQIAAAADLSKPNVLYYFPSKEAIYRALLSRLLDTWLDPLREIDPDGDPVEELLSYLRRKLRMSRELPRESRLFAIEIVQGAPRIGDEIDGPLRALVDKKAALIRGWVEAGRLAPVEPYHLIFTIWSVTQHYSDFDRQVRGVLGTSDEHHFETAERFLEDFYRRALSPAGGA